VTLVRILLVEDDLLVCKALARLLGRSAEVTPVSSIQAAVAELELASDYDLILCDVMLGSESGTDLYRILERQATKTELTSRIAFMTGLGDEAEELADFRHVPCLTKPIDTGAALRLAEKRRGTTTVPSS
jgi:CheY-like chemotaxis protein